MSKVKQPLTKKQCIAWIDKLRNPTVEQATGMLEKFDGSQCCLGVLREVCNLQTIPKSNGQLVIEEPDETVFKLSVAKQRILWQMNDNDRASFATIADYVEKNILPKCK